MIHRENVHAAFTPQECDSEQLRSMAKVNQACEDAARVILDEVPEGADQQASIRKLREAAMTANKGVATKGKL